MSEFNIVKCKKCDAALVELTGEKLTQCIQCGYKFNLTAKTTSHNSLQNKIENMPEVAGIVKKLKEISSTSKKTKIPPKKKKKSNPIGTIIFIIIGFNILKEIFSN